MITVIDTLENLTASEQVIPDGMIVKVKGSEAFKIGDGVHKFSDLAESGGSIKIQENKVPVGNVKEINFESFDATLDANGVLTVKNLSWYDGGSYDLPFNSYSRKLDGGEVKIGS